MSVNADVKPFRSDSSTSDAYESLMVCPADGTPPIHATTVVRWVVAGKTWDEIRRDYGLTDDQIRTCLEYAVTADPGSVPPGSIPAPDKPAPEGDAVNHPRHYNSHPAGIECIDVIEHFQCNIANAMKYLWRAGLKAEDPEEDLAKSQWYVTRELERVRKAKGRS